MKKHILFACMAILGADIACARFISADPFEGRQTDPRTLNRYAYASGNPVQNTDPSGEMTLGEVTTTLNNVANMSMRAYNSYDFIDSFLAGSDTVDGKQSLMESLMATTIKAAAESLSTDDLLNVGSTVLSLATAAGGSPGHHTVPIYMCGGRTQERVRLARAEHEQLHAQLLGFTKLVNIAGTVYQVLGRRRPGGAIHPPMIQVARTPYGREAIAAGLAAFYQTQGSGGSTWASKGRGEFSGRRLQLVFMKETWKFAAANHTWPRCQR